MSEEIGQQNDKRSPPETDPKPETKAHMDELFARLLTVEERERLERVLLGRLKARRAELEQLLARSNSYWTYEDSFHRFYHQSFKVYGLQTETEHAARVLRELLLEHKLNLASEDIVREGKGKEFEMDHNKDRPRHTHHCFGSLLLCQVYGRDGGVVRGFARATSTIAQRLGSVAKPL